MGEWGSMNKVSFSFGRGSDERKEEKGWGGCRCVSDIKELLQKR